MSSPAAATVLYTVRPALFLLVPVVALVLVVVGLAHRVKGQERPQTRIAYAFIASLSALSSVAGVLPFTRASNAQTEECIQTFLSLLLGASVLHLLSTYERPRGAQLITRIIRPGLLVIALSSATLLALLSSFLPSAVPGYVPPALFTAYTLLALLRISILLYNSNFPPLLPNSLPIAIHVATHRSSGSIPLTLGSFQQDGIEPEIANQQHRRNRRHQKLTSVDSATSSSTNSSESQELSVPQPPPPSLLTSPASELIHLPGVVERTEFSAQLHDSRSQNVLVFLVAAQILLLAGYVCSLGARTHFVHILALQIARAVCSVLAIAGTMSAYLLHAYNTHIRPRLPQSASRPPSRISASIGLVANGYHITTTADSVHPHANATSSPVQMVSINSFSQTRPVMINLAPPRRRHDTMTGAVFGSEKTYENGYAYGGLESCSPGSVPTSSGSCHHAPPYPPLPSTPQSPSYSQLIIPPVPTSPPPVPSSYSQPNSPTRSQPQRMSVITHREPIILTYEPPKRKASDSSLFQTTDAEPDADGHSSDGSLFSSPAVGSEAHSVSSEETKIGSGSHGHGYGYGEGKSKRRVSTRRMSKRSSVAPPLPPVPALAPNHSRKKPFEDPAAYISKRGSLPSSPKRFFGWEFAWDPLPKSMDKERRRELLKDVETSQESSFMDLTRSSGTGHWSGRGVSVGTSKAAGLSSSSLGKMKETRESRKLKRNTVGHAPSPIRISTSPSPPLPQPLHPAAAPQTALIGVPFPASPPPTGARKLKKRPVSRGTGEDSEKRTSFIRVEEASSSGTRPCIAPCVVGFTQKHLQIHRRIKSTTATTSTPFPRSSPRPSTADSGVGFDRTNPIQRPSFDPSEASVDVNSQGRMHRHANNFSITSLPSPTSKSAKRDSLALSTKTTANGQQLKNHFKLGVGRTLGPRLTLAAAGTGVEGKEDEDERFAKAIEDEETRFYSFDQEREVEDVGEAEVQSISAAKVMSASIARVAPAATIMAAPLAAPAFVAFPMSAPAATGMWMPHPFADSVEDLNELGAGGEDDSDIDFVILERELEEIRGKFPDFKMSDSVTSEEKSSVTTDLEVSTKATPGRKTTTPGPKAEKVKARTLSKPRSNKNGGIRRNNSNSKSSKTSFKLGGGVGNLKSEWAPQSSASSPSASASASPVIPYKFPMFFPNSIVPSVLSATSGPPTPTQPQSPLPPQSRSAPATPRGTNGPRLSALRMGSVRSAFAGVGAMMTTRMGSSSNIISPPTSPGLGAMIMDDPDGDFMDLRDPFAPPPPATSHVRRSTSEGNAKGDNFLSVDSSDDGHGQEDVFGSAGSNLLSGSVGSIGRKMSAWGRLPIPARSAPSQAEPTTVAIPSRKRLNSSSARASTKARKHRKEKRTRKTTLTSLGGVKVSAAASKTLDEDGDYNFEEALLTQRLLRRLDSDGWEYRT